MKLLRLKIHNIASIGDAEIDFSEGPLAKSPVFLISGETGSGKTTILDAICLALYNRTPRLSNPRSDEDFSYTDGYDTIDVRDPRQMLKKGESEGYVDLDFIGSDHQKYTAKWSVSMTTSGKIHLKAQEWILISPDGHQDTTKTSARYARMAQVTGLDFSQFCRTSMLAQGEFTRFLKADTSEKSAILEKITGTGIYAETGKSINRKKNEANSLLKELKKEKERYAPAEGYDMEAQRLGLQSLKEKSQSDVAHLREYRDAEDSRKRLAEADRQVFETSVLIEQDEASLKTLDAFMDYSQAQTATGSLSLFVSNRQKHEEASGTVMTLTPALGTKRAELKSGADALEALVTEWTAADKKVKGLQEEVDAMNPSLLMTQRTQAHDHLTELEKAEMNFGLVEKERGEANDLVGLRDAAIKYQSDCKEALAQAETAVQTQQTVFDAAQKVYLKVSDSVDDYTKKLRASIEPGDKCPVCGHVVDEILRDEDFDQMFLPVKEAYTTADAELKKAKDTRNTCQADLKGADKSLDKAENDVKAKNDRIRRMEERFDVLYSGIGLTVGMDGIHEVMTQKKAEAEAVKADVEAKFEVYDRLNGSLTTARNAAEALRAKVEAAKEAIETLKADIASKESSIAAASALAESSRAAMEEMKQKASACFRAEGFWDSFIADPAAFITRIEETAKTYDGLNRSVHTNKALFTSASETSKKEEEVQSAFALKYPELVEGDGLAEAVRTLETTIEADNRLIGQMETRLQAAEENAAKYEELSTKEQEQSILLARWTELDDCFGGADGKKFRTLAQSFIMNDILSRANHYLKKITDRYEMFSQPGSLVILLRDNDEGGVLRSGNTLSGGEGFIVSLALALGLSTLGTNDLGSDIVFIDEGFGTLSPNVLELVVSTLEKISAVGGRKVGIISHVKELGDRIPAQLRLVRTDQTTCKVEMHIDQ